MADDDDRNYKPLIAVWSIVSLVLAVLFIGAGIAGLNSGRSIDLFYVQIATTILGLLLSISETVLAFYVIAKFAQDDKAEAKQNHTTKYKHPQTTLYNFTEAPKSIFYFFLGVLCLNVSLISLFWALSSIMSYPTFGIRSYYHFRFVDLIIGYFVPVLVHGGLALLLITLQVITKYAFQPEGIFASLIVFVCYKRYNEDKTKKDQRYCDLSTNGDEQVYTLDFGAWSIVDYFFYPIIEVPDDAKDVENMYKCKENYTRLKRFIDKWKIPSLCFGAILTLNILLSLRVITEAIVIQQVGGRTLSCNSVEDNMDCFAHFNRMYVDCSEDNSTYNMDCFRYYKLSEIDPLGALIRAIFLFITYEKFLQLLFGIVATLYKIRYTKAWGYCVLIIGLIMSMFSVLCLIFYDQFETGFVFLSVFQFTILSLDIFLAGFLLVINCGYFIGKDGRLTLGEDTTVNSEEIGNPATNTNTNTKDNPVFALEMAPIQNENKTEEANSQI